MRVCREASWNSGRRSQQWARESFGPRWESRSLLEVREVGCLATPPAPRCGSLRTGLSTGVLCAPAVHHHTQSTVLFQTTLQHYSLLTIPTDSWADCWGEDVDCLGSAGPRTPESLSQPEVSAAYFTDVPGCFQPLWPSSMQGTPLCVHVGGASGGVKCWKGELSGVQRGIAGS